MPGGSKSESVEEARYPTVRWLIRVSQLGGQTVEVAPTQRVVLGPGPLC